jgi:hypothetical protein
MVIPSLLRGGYHFKALVNIGVRLGGDRPHIIDALAWGNDGVVHLLSSKWQQTSGTAEQKVPFEVICLANVVASKTLVIPGVVCTHCGDRCPASPAVIKAHLILGGEGWKLRQFYVSGGLQEFIPHSELVNITTLEAFVAQANKGML